MPRRHRGRSGAPTDPRAAGASPSPAAAVPNPARPATWRDPWAWLSALSVLPIVLHSLGAPLGEPVADDFDYLERTLLHGGGSLFDGGGAVLYWRPLGRQIYFGLMGRLIVTHPGLDVLLHVVTLSLIALLLFRAFRTGWSGPWSAAAASFILLAESARMLIAWPSHFMDLGALLFMALALHEMAHRRLVAASLAVLASLLFKEVAVLAALLVPWFPAPGIPRRERLRGSLAMLVTVTVWAAAYLLVTRHASLELPHQLQPGGNVSPGARLAWALVHSLRAQFSVEALPGRWDAVVSLSLAALVAVALWRSAANADARARLVSARGWIAWGAAWFAVGVLPLVEVFPGWAPYRSLFAGVGLGVALLALLAPLGSAGIAALVALRLAGFVLSPGPPATITDQPTEAGATLDFPKLVRLERFVRGTRTLLQESYPRLPHGAQVGQHRLPQMTEYALAGDKALQVWYRDTTARWIGFEQFRRRLDLPLVTVVEFEQARTPQLALVSPDAVRALLQGLDLASRSQLGEALAEFDRAEALQRDPHAAVFLGQIAGKRAWFLLALGRGDAAEREALRGYALWPDNPESRLVLASRRLDQGRLPEARSLIDTLLVTEPGDEDVLALQRRLVTAAGAPR